MPYPLPLTRTEAYLAYKAGVIQQSDLKPSLAVPRNGIDAWLAYWTGLAADYPKREDGTPHILQEEEAYIAYLCGVINEYPEKCLRRVGAYLRYLISARWGRPDHPLNREELYLSLIKTQFIPSGDPSSDITIDGTAKAPFVDVKMYGDTYQNTTYTGAQMLKKQGMATPSSDTIYWASFTNLAQTPESDGWAKLEKTATSNYANFNTSVSSVDITGGETYTAIVEVKNSTFTTGQMVFTQPGQTQDPVSSYTIVQGCEFTNENSMGIYLGSVSSPNVYTFVAKSSFTRGLRYYIQTATTGSVEVRATVLAGDHSSDWQNYCGDNWQPYVGGMVSPNSGYPQPVETVTGLQTIEITGKNLFDVDNANVMDKYYFDGSLASSEIAYAPLNPRNLLVWIACKPSTTYSITVGSKTNISQIQVGEAATKPEEGVTVSSLGSVGSSLKLENITTSNQAHYLVIRMQTPTSYIAMDYFNSVFGTAQIEAGSTATAYEPYSKHTHPINLGKNLCSSIWESGQYNTTTGVKNDISGNRTADFIPVEPNTKYIVSRGGSGVAMNVMAYNADKTYQGFIGTISAGNYFTTPSGCRYITMYRGVSGGINDMMLEKGTTITSYAPYFEPIELCKLETYEDYIYKSDGDWFIEKYIKKVVLDGTDDENLNWYAASTPSGGWIKFNANCKDMLFHQHPVVCSHFKYLNQDNANSGIEHVYTFYGSHGFNIWVKDTLATTLEEWRTWLANNKPVLYYELQEPVVTQITNTDLIEQLEALVNGGAENGTTYIKVNATDPNLPGLLYVEAPKYE